MKYIVQPDGLGTPLGRYSHIALDEQSGLVSIAGQVGTIATGDLAGDGSMASQVQQVFENLATAIASVGGSMTDIFKLTTYLIKTASIEEFMFARTEAYSAVFPAGVYPPNTLLVVDRLVEERFVVEVEALALVRKSVA